MNLFKIYSLPSLKYLIYNSPIWLPMSLHRGLDRDIRSFIWLGEYPQFSIHFIQLPDEMGGLPLPKLYLYFLASQLFYVCWWFTHRHTNPCTVLKALIPGSNRALVNYLHRLTPSLGHSLTMPMKKTLKGLCCDSVLRRWHGCLLLHCGLTCFFRP